MVDVAEWPKWLNDIVTRLDASSSAEGPSAVHGPAAITPSLRKALRDNCIELHHLHLERSQLRAQVEAVTEERDFIRAKLDDAIRVACAASNDAERALREAELL